MSIWGTPSGASLVHATDVNANGSVVVGYGWASRGFLLDPGRVECKFLALTGSVLSRLCGKF